MLLDDGWYLDEATGSHHQFQHLVKQGRVTVPHPRRHLKVKTLLSILRQSGLKGRNPEEGGEGNG